jgi:hypothetical protein
MREIYIPYSPSFLSVYSPSSHIFMELKTLRISDKFWAEIKRRNCRNKRDY